MPTNHKLLFINNPKGSNNARVQKKILQLEKTIGHKIKTITSEKDPKKFEEKFKRHIADNADTIVLIGGGDGTVHQVAEATIKLPKNKRNSVMLLPIWGGNANDLANMLNGISVNKNLFSIINKGKAVTIHPIKISVGSKTNYAVCYASFGASANAADVIDKSGPARKGRFHNFAAIIVISEVFSVLRAFVKSPSFSAQINSEEVKIFDQAFTNGSRIAKVDRIPLNLTDQKYYKFAQPKKNSTMLVRIFKLLSGKQVGEITDKPTEFIIKEPVLAQYDGEVSTIPADTLIKVELSKKNIKALATKNV